MKPVRIITYSLLIAAGLSLSVGAVVTSRHDQHHRQIIEMLTQRNLVDARSALNGYHDWIILLARIETTRNPALIQAALDVQFEYWYSKTDDTNYSYPEQVDVVRRLMALGAKANYSLLTAATKQNKMQLARLFLSADIPVESGTADSGPLQYAAYWGDTDLVEALLARGANINQSTLHAGPAILEAAWSCQTNCVELLLRHGADLNLSYEAWAGNIQPVWKVIEARSTLGAEHCAIWNLISAHRSQTNYPINH